MALIKDLEKHKWKFGDNEIWGRGMQIDISEWAKKTKQHEDNYIHVNAYQRVTSENEHFKNQVGRMAHSVDTSQPLFLVTLAIVPWTHEQSAHGQA